MVDVTAVIQDSKNNRWLTFQSPVAVLSTQNPDEVINLLNQVQLRVKQEQLFAVGFVSYEAANAFDKTLETRESKDFPLIWFGLFKSPETFNIEQAVQDTATQPTLDWKQDIKPDQYQYRIQQIKDHIKAGDCYQINYTHRFSSYFSGDAWTFFMRMIRAQNLHKNTGYCAFIETNEFAVLSASPELFFSYDGQQLISEPMKGTSARGKTIAQDLKLRDTLLTSPKDRAENIMITDMVRNDIGKIADTGSVTTSPLLQLHQYPTFYTLTSRVHGQAKNLSTADIFSALFPAASITGSPKRRAMEIIASLETSTRRLYTGSIGFIAPDNYTQFNVAIRTVLLDKTAQSAEFGVGGGIVWDSKAEQEFAECLTKTHVLSHAPKPFDLITSAKWTPENGILWLKDHIDRLRQSAQYFAFNFSEQTLIDNLRKHEVHFPLRPQKVRISLSESGQINITNQDIKTLSYPYNLRISQNPINRQDISLYHKTTNRDIYDNARQEFKDCDDIVLINDRSEITETTIANIFIFLNNEWLTPTLECGLLEGIARKKYITALSARETRISVEQLRHAKEICLVNAVREKWSATLI